MRIITRLVLPVVIVATALLPAPTSAAAAPEGARDGVAFSVGNEVSYDDNLFRLPEGLALAGRHRADWINRATAGAALSKAVSRQQFDLAARVARNDYRDSDDLSNTSGAASLGWRWQAGDRLDGSLGGSYLRELAGFANNRFLSRDPIETTTAFVSARLRAFSHVSLTANARRNDATHAVDVRRVDDLTLDSGGFGVEYRTVQGNLLAWDYRYSQGDYRAVQGFDRDFEENYSGGRWEFELHNRFRFDGSAGYARRTAANAGSLTSFASEYSGVSGRGSLSWAVGAKTRVVFEGFRELRAYADAESDYFVARGGAIRPEWQATAKILLSAEVSREQLDFLGASGVAPPVGAVRHDQIEAAELRVRFDVAAALALTATVRHENRTSSRPDCAFRDNRAQIGVQLRF